MSELKSRKNTNPNKKGQGKITDERKKYLVFSDAQIDFIDKHQKKINIEFSEDEKNFSFI